MQLVGGGGGSGGVQGISCQFVCDSHKNTTQCVCASGGHDSRNIGHYISVQKTLP